MLNPKQRRRLLLVSVFFANLLSLACQVVWVRKLSFLFGSSAAVFATVLSIFLLGLATGAFVGGRLADRSADAWRLLSRALIALGIWCGLSIPLFELARAGYLAVAPLGMTPFATAVSKALVVLVCLLVPTSLIGAVFPLATKLVAIGTDDLGHDLSVIYALDTLGAGAGAILAGFVLVPRVGLWGSAALLGAGAVVLGIRLQAEKPGATPPPKPPKKAKQQKGEDPAPASLELPATPGVRGVLVLLTFFCTGLAALLFETGWNRFFYVLNGTSVYSLSTVLAGFLGGLGVGSFWMRRHIGRVRDPLATAAVLFAVVALGGVLVLRSATLFTRAYFVAFALTSSYTVFLILVCAVIFAIVFVAAIAMGANFPLVALIVARDPETRATAVGKVFAVNTMGGVLGAFVAEFVLLPKFSFTGLTLVALGLYAAAAIVFLLLARPQPIARHAMLAAGLIGTALLLSPLVLPFDLPYHALYYHGLRDGSYSAYQEQVDMTKPRWQKDGFYGRVAVFNYGDFLLLKHNGKTDASDGGDNYGQIWMSQAPLLLHPAPKDVLNIGLGGGLTLRGIVHHAEVERITSIEIDPLVVEAARTEFGKINEHAIDDPRVETVIADGRNFVEGTPKQFDVIVSEPPNVWVAGVSGLFTREFYTAARSRLKPGGILSQWLPIYELEKEDFALALRTLRQVFPHVAVWSNGSDAVVIASESPLTFDDAVLARKLAASGVQRDLTLIGMQPEAMASILRQPTFDEQTVNQLAESVTEINTDNLPLLEFRTARNLFVFNQPEYKARTARRR
ncbi:MAG: fused MFS/spermidine synthase [Thermoanaerobaculia bacterium]|jgi:predicted membrane-bound spermidine synthase